MQSLKSVFVILLCVPVVALLAGTTNEPREGIRGHVFDQTNLALTRADAVGASVLTPKTYRRATKAYRKAETAFADNVDLDRVRTNLLEAQQYFDQAAEQAPGILARVDDGYQARLDALRVQANQRSPALWADAERMLLKATSRAEKGRSTRIDRYVQKAEVLYREAELAAIEVALFADLEIEMEAARKLDAQYWAPKSYSFAIDLRSQAQFEIKQDRYATVVPGALVDRALHFVKHAQYVAALANALDDNDTTLEEVLLEWEFHIQALALDLGQAVYFDAGPAESIALLRRALAESELRRAANEQALVESHRKLTMLEDELSR